MSDTVIRVENISKLYRLGKVGPKGAAPKGRRKSKYLHQWLRARAHEKVILHLVFGVFQSN